MTQSQFHTNSQMRNSQSKHMKEGKMGIVRTTTAALVSGFLMSGAFAPAWSAPSASDKLSVAQATSASPLVQAAGTILGAPEFSRIRVRPNALNNCKPGQIYSMHNVVGDPQTCIMSSVGGANGAYPTAVGAPGL